MPFVENFAVFLNSKEFGDTATWTQQISGLTVALQGIFEANYINPLNLVQAEESSFLTTLSDIPAVRDQDFLFVRGKNYKIRVVERDVDSGQGLVMLHLKAP